MLAQILHLMPIKLKCLLKFALTNEEIPCSKDISLDYIHAGNIRSVDNQLLLLLTKQRHTIRHEF